MESSSTGQTRRKSERSSSAPYSKPDANRRKSLLHKVGESVAEMLTPSWLSSFMSRPSDDSVDNEVFDQGGGDLTAALNRQASAIDNANPASANISSQPYNPGYSMQPSAGNQQQFQHRAPLAQVTQVAGPVGQSQYMLGGENPVPIVPMTQSMSQPSTHQQYGGGRQMSYSQHPHTSSVSQENNAPPSSSVHIQQQGRSNPMSAAAAGPSGGFHSMERQSSKRGYLNDSPTRQDTPSKRLNLSTSLFNDSAAVEERNSSFNISSFAKSFSDSMNGSILNSKNLNNSSYYPGKTTFGGMASKKSFTLPTASPYHRTDQATARRSVSNQKKAENPVVTRTSKAAKLILKALDKTGLEPKEDEKIVKAFNPAVYLRRREQQPSSKISVVSTPPLATMPKSAPVKHTSNFHKPDIFGKSNSSVVVEQSSTPKSAVGGKLKRDKGHGHYSNKMAPEDEMVDMPQLPTNITLNMAGMPKIDFGAPPKAPPMPASFNFSTPVSLSGGNVSNNATLSPTLGEFSFGSPLDAQKAASIINKPDPITALPKSSPDSSGTDVAKTQPLTTAAPVSNAASAPKIGSGTPSNTSSGWGDMFKNKGLKWSCPGCLIQNDSNVAECLACHTKNPTKTPTSEVAPKKPDNPVVSSQSGWGNLFKGAAAKWSCPMCLIQNDMEKAECVACQAKNPKSSSKPVSKEPLMKVSESLAASKPLAASSQGFGDLLKKSAGKWSCGICLIQNDQDKTVCDACQTKKPNSTAPKTTAASTPASGSGCGDKFKKPTGQWSCGICMLSNSADKTNCVACQSAKPASASTTALKPTTDVTGTSLAGWSNSIPSKSTSSSSSWGSAFTNSSTWQCTTCLISNQSNISLCVACGAYKPGTQSSLGDLSKGKQLPVYEAKKLDPSLLFGTSKPVAAPSSNPVGSALSMFGSKAPAAASVAQPSSIQAAASSIFPTAKPAATTLKDKAAPSVASSILLFPAQSAGAISTAPSASSLMFPAKPAAPAPVSAAPAPASVTTALSAESSLIFGNMGTKKPEVASKPDNTSTMVKPTAVMSTPFSFGKLASDAKVDKPVVQPTFQFGATTKTAGQSADEKTKSSVQPTFQFGATTKPAKPSAAEKTKPATQPTFQFGASNKPTVQPAAEKSSDATPAGLFSFGSKPKQATDNKPAAPAALFGAPASSAPVSAGLFSFKAAVPSIESSAPPAQPPAASLFGAMPSMKRTAGSDAMDGAKKSSISAADQAPPAKAPVFGSMGSSSGGFNFGASAAGKPTFQFGSGAPSGGLFGGNSATGNTATPVFGGSSATSGGVFGSSAGVFGSGQTAGAASSVPVFGIGTQAASSLFGSSAPATGLFGSTQPSTGTSQQPAPTMFGAPASGGLFQSAASSGGIFGSNPVQPVQTDSATSEGQSSAASGGFSMGTRTMKKAVRRIKK